MTGETRSDESGWTVDTLKPYFDRILLEMDTRYEQRFEAMREAIGKAERATELRFESVNEFRQTLSDRDRESQARSANFVTRDAFSEAQKAQQGYRDSVAERIDAINTRINLFEGERAGGKDVKGEARANVAMLIAIAAALFNVVLVAVQLLRTSGG